MELFKLFGTIAINNSEANSALDATTDKAQSFSQKLSEKFVDAGTKTTNLGKKLSLGLTTPLLGIGTAAVKATADFESSMSEVAAISGATGSDLAALEEKAKEMGKTTKFSASESAEALKYMAMAGWKTTDMLDGLEGIMNLAAASGEDLGTTSDIVTDALTAFGLKASDSGHFADILATASSNANTNVNMMGETFKYVAPVAGSLGYSAEDTAEAIGLMANAGIKSSQAGTSLRSILSNLQGEVKFAGAGFGEMTVQTTNADGSMRSLGEILGDCRTAFSMMSESERASNAEMVVGREAMSGFLAIMNAAPADIDKLNNAIKNCDGSAKSMADTMNDNLSGQITILKSQLEALAIQFITLIMPYLMKAVEWLQKLCDWISGLDDNTKRMIITIAGIAAAVGPVLVVGGKIISGAGKIVSGVSSIIGVAGKITPVIGTVVSAGGKVVVGIGSLVGKIAGVLIPAITSISAPVLAVIAVLGLLVAAGVAVYKNWDEIKAWASNAWGAIKETVGNAVDAIKGFFSSINEKFSELKENISAKVHEMKENVSAKISEMKEHASARINEMKEAVSSKVHEMKENVFAKVSEMKEHASAKISEMKEAVSSKIGEMKEAVSSKIHEMKEHASAKISEMKEAVSSKVHEMKEAVSSRISEMKETVSSKISEMKEAVSAKVSEMKEHASAKISEMKEAVSSRISEMKETVSSKVEDMKENAVSKIQELKEKGAAGFEDLKARGLEKLESLKSGVSQKMEAIKNAASIAVQRLKDCFNFDWKLPEIKLPHFSVEGSFSLNPPSIPSFGIEWYKDGGVMTDPTAFGINPYSGKVMAGGEAGAEAIAPIETLKEYVREAVDGSNQQLYGALAAILSLLREYLPELAQKQLIMDTGALVGELGEPMYDEFGRIAHNRERRN